MIYVMRKISLVCILLAMSAFALSCGATEPAKQEQNTKFPISARVNEVIKSENMQLSLEREGKTETVLLDGKSVVYYNDKIVMKESIQKDQTVYVEGDVREGIAYATKLVITSWPGRTDKGPDIKIDPKMIPGKIAAYLAETHPELEIDSKTNWTPLKDPPKTPPNTVMDIYQSPNYLLVVKYEATKDPQTYTILLTTSFGAQANWSGTIEKDGKILEKSYEK